MTIDTERLVQDLRHAADEAMSGESSAKLRWMARAWLIVAGAIEDGDYESHEERERIVRRVDWR